MGEMCYAPIIDGMVWSHSRIKTFHDCPYRWYLKYIRAINGKPMFFSDYGLFMHKLLEQYAWGEKTREELCETYLAGFQSSVRGRAPSEKVFANYFKSGLQYLRNIEPLPFTPVSVEEKVELTIDGVPFVGVIDLLGERDGELYVVDHKSRALKPRSKRGKPTKTDRELDDYLRQLYLYAATVEDKFGKRPKSLCFNCFRTRSFIEEPFQEKAFAESKEWLLRSVDAIRAQSDFKPNLEYFKCSHLCEMNDVCEYFALSKKR